jgi:hypothetical protein
MVQPFHPFFAQNLEADNMIKSLIACCVAATFTFQIDSAYAQDGTDFLSNVSQANTSILVTSAMNNIAMQNTLPPERRAPGYGNTPTPRSKAATGSYDRFSSTQSNAPVLTSLKYTPQSALSRSVQSEFLARTRRFNPEVGALVAAQMEKHNFTAVYATYVDAAKIPMRDPGSSMALYTAIGWAIANGVELSGENPGDVVRVQALRRQSLATLGQRPDINSAGIRQRLDEEFMILMVLLDAGRISARDREGPAAAAEFSNGVHNLWKKQFGLDLRKVTFDAAGMNKR